MKGIERKYLFECEDELGKCYLGYAGNMPEQGRAFYYFDEKYEFCFYVDRTWDGRKFDVNVKTATIYHMHGPRPHIDDADIDRIRCNMEQFFTARSFRSPSEPARPDEEFRNLTLSWVLP